MGFIESIKENFQYFIYFFKHHVTKTNMVFGAKDKGE